MHVTFGGSQRQFFQPTRKAYPVNIVTISLEISAKRKSSVGSPTKQSKWSKIGQNLAWFLIFFTLVHKTRKLSWLLCFALISRALLMFYRLHMFMFLLFFLLYKNKQKKWWEIPASTCTRTVWVLHVPQYSFYFHVQVVESAWVPYQKAAAQGSHLRSRRAHWVKKRKGEEMEVCSPCS